ncbi:hypothetical protein Ciccas_009206, partial [Cichlidogyrus casuarinus]
MQGISSPLKTELNSLNESLGNTDEKLQQFFNCIPTPGRKPLATCRLCRSRDFSYQNSQKKPRAPAMTLNYHHATLIRHIDRFHHDIYLREFKKEETAKFSKEEALEKLLKLFVN